MKFNKWTLGLAAVGVVSLTSAARADETNMVQTALSNTTISGYVDASAQFNPGGGGSANNAPNYNFGNNANEISLNVVQVSLDKPLDEAPWASGYHVDLWLGPDASVLGTSTSGGDAALRQAYIALRTPIGNGIDWKIGVFDTIIGYEGLTSGNNPNFTHSYGFNIEPTTHTGVLAVYHAFDWLTAQFGVADQSYSAGTGYSAAINGFPAADNRNGNGALSTPTLMWGPTLTAPESWGWAKGGTLSFGTINTSGSAGATSFYAGVTVPTPIAKLKFGGSFDYLNVRNNAGAGAGGNNGANTWNLAGYSTYAFNDKLSLNLRGEHLQGTSALNGGAYFNTTAFGNNAADEITATLQYNLWENVLTRVEIRWDHVEHGNGYASASASGVGTESEAWLIGAQAIYTF